jgi:death on curing protein
LRETRALDNPVRPQTGYYGDLVAEAAALWETLSQNHPFVDGNKRTAFAATFTFLVINGLEITASADEAWSFLSDRYETGTMKFDMLDAWLRDNTPAWPPPRVPWKSALPAAVSPCRAKEWFWQ